MILYFTMRGKCLLWFLLITSQIDSTVLQDEDLYDIDLEEDEDGPWSVLPDFMDYLCPNADICSTKLGYTVTNDGPACCKSCSCEPDCGLTNTCCYQELDLYPDTDTSPKTCLFPVTKLYITKILPIQSYLMVDKCPGDIGCQTCGNEKVAEWGSLYPVYSMDTGLVYKNAKCAECYNVTDGQLWDPYLIVNTSDVMGDQLTAGHVLTSRITDASDLFVRFTPPNGRTIEPQMCYIDLIDECKHDFAYSIYNNITDHSHCKRGLRAPVFYDGNYYANIFCLICILNGNRFRRGDPPCSVPNNVVTGDFIAEIDNTVTYQEDRPTVIMAYTTGRKKGKEVLCPAGHYTYYDECVLVHSKWLHTHFELVLEFSPPSVNDGLYSSNVQSFDLSISVPEHTGWELMKTIIEHDDTNFISHVYAILSWKTNNTGHVIPADVLKATETLVAHSETSILAEGKVFKYKVGFSRYAYFSTRIEKREVLYEPLWLAVKQSRQGMLNEPGSFDKKSEFFSAYEKQKNSDNRQVPISIHRLFFCQQVELAEKEFISFYNGTQIYYKKTGRYFLDGEFMLGKRDDGKRTARICLQDSDYTIPGSGTESVMTDKVCLLLFLVWWNLF